MPLMESIKRFDSNFEYALIFFLPLVLLLLLIYLPIDILLPSLTLGVFLLLYISITYERRLIYGFSGLRLLAIPSIIITTYTVFIALPSIYIISIKEHSNEIYYFSSIVLFYPLFAIGLLTGNLFKRIDKKKIGLIPYQKFLPHKFDKLFYEVLLLLFSVSILIFIVYLFRVDKIPFLELIQDPGGSSKFFNLRESALKTLTMSKLEKYMFFWLRSLFVPFGIIGSLFLTNYYKNKNYKYLFILFLIFGLTVNTITIEKSPVASIFLSIATLIFLKQVKIRLWLMSLLIIATLAGPVIITYLIFIDRSNLFNLIFWSYFNRIFIIPSEVLYYYFQYFPDTHDFLIGRSSQLFSWLYQNGTFPISNYIAQLWWNDPNTSGSANAIFLGNFWADFGMVGTIISSFIFGIIIHIFEWKLLKTSNYKKNFLYITTTAVSLPVFTFGFFSSNFTILFFTKGLIFLVLFLIGIDYLQNKIKPLTQ